MKVHTISSFCHLFDAARYSERHPKARGDSTETECSLLSNVYICVCIINNKILRLSYSNGMVGILLNGPWSYGLRMTSPCSCEADFPFCLFPVSAMVFAALSSLEERRRKVAVANKVSLRGFSFRHLVEQVRFQFFSFDKTFSSRSQVQSGRYASFNR